MINRIKELEATARLLEISTDERRQLTNEVISYVEKFYAESLQIPVYSITDDKGIGLYDSPISPDPMDIKEALALLRHNVDRPGVNQISPRHLAFIPAGGLYPAALGDYLSAVTNRYSGLFYGAPGAVRMENMLLRWMSEIIGYPTSAAGNLTSGGSMANLISIVTARDARNLKARDYERSVVYMTEERHHSIDKGLRIAGFSEYVPRFISMDPFLRMNTQELAAQITADRQQGLNPWLIVANAGTIDAGVIDPLTEIGEIARENELWLHIDGAYGAFFVLCELGRQKLLGIQNSDSISMDPHKSLFLPWGSGAVLVKNGKALLDAHHYEATYLQDAQNAEELSPADLSPELTRNFRGLRLWLPLKLFGTRPFAAALEEKLLLAQYFHSQLSELNGFKVGPQPDLSVVLFRYLPKHGDAAEFNAQLAENIKRDGRIFLSTTRIGQTFWIRMAVLAYHTHLDTIDVAINVIREKVAELLGE